MGAALADQGVEVTGWMSHDAASARLAQCDLYLHFAAWEGFPMTVIEAAAMGRPILLRAISAFDGFDMPAHAMVQTPADAARRLAQWVQEPATRAGSYAMIDTVRTICSRDRQAAALRELYRVDAA
jgi:glycosyltransferase involved in cell wall biosynthesis